MKRSLVVGNSKFSCHLILMVSFVLSLSTFAVHAQRPEYQIIIENHLFYPANITIPVNSKVKLVIFNRDQTVEEFDSFSLNREKVIFANQKGVIFIGPLPEGEYSFFGEYHPHSARGKVIVVKEVLFDQIEKGEQHVN